MGQIGSQSICGNCGAANAPGEQFCGNCGYSLAGGPTAPTIVPPTNTNAATIASSASRRVTGALVVGNLLSGRYRIVRPVGKGGFGAVYKARDERFQARRMLAIKEMSDSQLTPTERIQAIRDFRHKQGMTYNNKRIQVVLDEFGSVDSQSRILSGDIRPTAWSPASFLELNQLSTNWQQQHNGADIIINNGDLLPKSLVFSPLVFAVWKQRADVLLQHYHSIDWPEIHDALTKSSWADIGGQSAWGPVKFGQTRPDQSNSGLLTITLLAYAANNEERNLTIAQLNSPAFLKYFTDIEGAVNAFGRSSGTFLQNVVIQEGPPQYDIVTTYENLVLTSQQQAISRQHQELLLFYPSVNILSDHPFAILQGSWVTDEERMAAKIFRDFLLSTEPEGMALSSGFRPTIPGAQITDNVQGNAFRGQPPDIIISPQIQSLAQAPSGVVINRLWQGVPCVLRMGRNCHRTASRLCLHVLSMCAMLCV